MALPRLESVEFDFEEYALTQGIPETVDPLPYRKAGSVFATGDEAEPTYTSAKHDPRLRTVVCRHWLRDLCMKGSACEFLHQYDLSKMPLCRHGDRCKVKDCPFRHISDADRLECVFYCQGFCIHGPFCRYKHARRDRADLPAVADFTLGLSQMQAGKDGTQQPRRPAPKPNEFYKVSLCKHFMQGDCPFGEGCHFAHGEHELKKFPRMKEDSEDAETNELSDNMFGDHDDTATFDYFQGGPSGGGKPSPILEPEQAYFFIVRAATHHDLAISTKRGEWWLQKCHADRLNDLYSSSSSSSQPVDGRQIMIFFTVSESDHIQGAALMTSLATSPSCLFSANEEEFTHRIHITWYRTTELPIRIAFEAAPDLILPTKETQFCEDMSCATGESLMKAVWNSPLVTLYESYSGEKPPAEDAILTDFRVPKDVVWPISPKPGFIFGCDNNTMDECLGRGIFGLPAHMKGSALDIGPGSVIFLFNVKERLLFGVFEALTVATRNIEPTLFSKSQKAQSSPFPVQIRVQVSLECPPVQESDPVLNDILRNRGGKVGPLTHAQAEAIASLLASQCGALQFMVEYRKAVEAGELVNPPPIALPPKKIGIGTTT